MAAACGADRCCVSLWRDQTLVPVVARYAPGLAPRDGRRSVKTLRAFRLDEVPPLARVRGERQPVVVVDPLRQPAATPAWRSVFGNEPFVALPLVHRNRFLGVFMLDNSVTRRSVGAIRIDVARVVAGQLALALDHARLARAMRSVIHEADTLLNVGAAVASTLDLSELVRRIVREAARAVGADSAGIYRVGERDGILEPLAAYHIPPAVFEGLGSQAVVRDEFRGLIDQPRWSDDVPNDPAFTHPIFKRFPTQSLLLVPVEVRSTRVGVLVCAWWTARRRIKPDELRLMEAIAGQAAVAIEAARLAMLAERAAVGRERTRMDCLLHDTLSSTLFALALKLDSCLHRPDCSTDLRARLETVKRHAQTMMTQIRALVTSPLADVSRP